MSQFVITEGGGEWWRRDSWWLLCKIRLLPVSVQIILRFHLQFSCTAQKPPDIFYVSQRACLSKGTRYLQCIWGTPNQSPSYYKFDNHFYFQRFICKFKKKKNLPIYLNGYILVFNKMLIFTEFEFWIFPETREVNFIR